MEFEPQLPDISKEELDRMKQEMELTDEDKENLLESGYFRTNYIPSYARQACHEALSRRKQK